MLFLTLLAEFLSALFSVDEHVVRVSEPLFLPLTDFPEPTSIVQFGGVHRVQQLLVYFGLQLFRITLKEFG
jgi:hypothetical protein